MRTPDTITVEGVPCPVLEREVERGVLYQSASTTRTAFYRLAVHPATGEVFLAAAGFSNAGRAFVSYVSPDRSRLIASLRRLAKEGAA